MIEAFLLASCKKRNYWNLIITGQNKNKCYTCLSMNVCMEAEALEVNSEQGTRQ